MEEQQQYWLKECLGQIEQQLGWGPTATWRNEDFEKLAERIFEQTRVRLSLSTMRRIWGRVKYAHAPNAATLNALAGFLGFDIWRTFCEQHPWPQAQTSPLVPVKKTNYRKKLMLAAILIVALLGVAVLKPDRSGPVGPSQFRSHKISDALPNSVVFDYSAGRAGDTGIMIRQSWDPALSEHVAGGSGLQHTSIYYYPGYFNAKLLVNGAIVQQTPVYITTNGWKGILQHHPKPIYLTAANASGISPNEVKQLLQTANLNDRWVEFDNFQLFSGIDPGHFSLALRLQNTATVEQALCRRAKLVIRGTISPVIIPLADKGCSSDLQVYTGDSTINGKQRDLSTLGCDFNSAQLLQVSINGQQLTVTLNQQPALQVKLKRPIGQIVGIRVLFEGGGVVTKANLYTPGKTAYDLL
jgi:hypothetical protein